MRTKHALGNIYWRAIGAIIAPIDNNDDNEEVIFPELCSYLSYKINYYLQKEKKEREKETFTLLSFIHYPVIPYHAIVPDRLVILEKFIANNTCSPMPSTTVTLRLIIMPFKRK